MTATVIPTYAKDITLVNNCEASVYAKDYFSGRTRRLNSVNGRESGASRISSESIKESSKVTIVELNVDVSRGSSPFYVIIENPKGKKLKNMLQLVEEE